MDDPMVEVRDEVVRARPSRRSGDSSARRRAFDLLLTITMRYNDVHILKYPQDVACKTRCQQFINSRQSIVTVD